MKVKENIYGDQFFGAVTSFDITVPQMPRYIKNCSIGQFAFRNLITMNDFYITGTKLNKSMGWYDASVAVVIYQGEIVAISIAQSSCYSSPRPSSAFSMWAHNGWKIDTKYLALPTSLKTEPFIPTLYGMQPPKGPYTATFRGKQQYLCKANKEMFDFLMKEILAVQLSTAVQNQIKNFVK